MMPRKKDRLLHIILVAPLLLYILGFTLAPVIQTFIMSFQDKQSGVFTLANYSYIMGHFQFKSAVINTLIVTFAGLSLEVVMGLILALLLTRGLKGQGVFRMLFLIPLGVPTIVAASNMRYIFDTYGIVNEIMIKMGLIDIPLDWTGGGALTLISIIVADMWKVTPLVMLILIAGLESIPKSLYESAEVDGATTWQKFRRITLPLLKPAITMALVIRGIDAFRIFEIPITLAGRSMPVLSTYAFYEYNEALNPYTSAASSVILLVMIFVAIGSYLKIAGGSEVIR